MREYYFKSIQMIIDHNIKSEEEYIKLIKEYNLLSAESLKYISQERNFRKIIEMAKDILSYQENPSQE